MRVVLSDTRTRISVQHQGDGGQHQQRPGHPPAQDEGAGLPFVIREPGPDEPDRQHAEQSAGGVEHVGARGVLEHGEAADKQSGLRAQQDGILFALKRLHKAGIGHLVSTGKVVVLPPVGAGRSRYPSEIAFYNVFMTCPAFYKCTASKFYLIFQLDSALCTGYDSS